MKAKVLLFICLPACILIQASCNSPKKETVADPLFHLLPSSETGITFNNKVADTKDFNVFKYRNFYNGGGVAIGDVNNDGKPDIFFTSNQQSNRLYINKGNWKFEDVTLKAGVGGIHKWHTGVAMADVNGDGWLDIYVSNSGDMAGDDRANELYINQKNGTFREEAHDYGLDDTGLGTQAVFFDYDHDGDLDCFVLNNSYRAIGSFGYNRNLRNIRNAQGGHRLYRNDKGKFKDVSDKGGIYGSEIGFGLGISVADLNNDGWDDIYVSNDFFERDYLYINQKNGTFKEVIGDEMQHISLASMGSDIADINNDGNLDIFTTDMLPEEDYRLKTTTKFDDYDVANAKLQNDFHHQFSSNSLQLSNGDNTYSEIAEFAGTDASDWSWGALSFDMDNDGWKDLFVCNGISKDLTNQDFLDYFSSNEVMNQVQKDGLDFKLILDKMPSTRISNYAFINQKNLHFRNEAKALGLATPGYSNGAAYGDLDGDGDLDLVVNNENMEAFVYRNMASEKLKMHYLKIKLKGSSANTLGIGARVIVYNGHNQQTMEQMQTRGFESSVEPVLNVGLGQNTHADSLIIIWPDMKKQIIRNIPADTTLTLLQDDANDRFYPEVKRRETLFKNVTKEKIKGDIQHRENYFFDFDAERLIPKMLSTEGPKLAVADVNGDGLTDFFMGAAAGDTSRLFLQKPDGSFIQMKKNAFGQDKDYEDVGAEFFDANNDGYPDLAVASGGNQEKLGSINTLPRLYINDGKGNFKRSVKSFPYVFINASCIRSCDFDGDGDNDIFIGGRSIPGTYGVAPNSVLLENDGKGNFKDVTKTVAPQFNKMGMVTDAQWADINGDGKKELVIVGDWMPVTIFNYANGKFTNITELPHSSGWWNCLIVTDIDGDGDLDLIAGNAGLNSKIKARENEPAKLYVSDFDDNGQTECVMTYYKSDNKSYPYNLRGDMVMQMPFLKKRFLQYSSYAGKTIDEIFTKEELNHATVLSVEQPQSCVFINDGKGNFTMQPLPVKAQLAPVFGVFASDLNNDGHEDIFLGGNFYGLKPELGRWDASYGCTLLGNSKHAFTEMPAVNSGLFVKGEIRDIKEIKTVKGNIILVARNNDTLQMFEKNNKK